jgi:hypothetical protein
MASNKDENPTYDIHEDKFEVPHVGVFKLHLGGDKPYVEQVSCKIDLDDVWAAMSNPNNPITLSMSFKDVDTLRAYLPDLANLSTKEGVILGDFKPGLVVGLGNKHERMKSDVESALRDHEVDAHVVMMPGEAGGGDGPRQRKLHTRY